MGSKTIQAKCIHSLNNNARLIRKVNKMITQTLKNTKSLSTTFLAHLIALPRTTRSTVGYAIKCVLFAGRNELAAHNKSTISECAALSRAMRRNMRHTPKGYVN